MSNDYLKYWNIDKPPFSLTPDPEMLFLSTQHSECLMRLKYAIFSQKGGALLVSDNAGNGKTSVLARLMKDLDDYYGGRVRVVFIDHPTLTPIEMIGEIAHQLGAELQTTEKIRALNHLRDRLFTLYNENIKVVVIVDEGQMLRDRPDILGELRILLNFCVSDAFLLTFIFSGQKPLDSILREMPEFWQRLPVRFFLRNLDYNDTKGLIRYRLEKVGGSPDIFTEDAFEGIYNYSEGCPRIICSVADLCLVIGFAKGTKRIGFVEVSNACRDMEASGDGYHYYAFMKTHDSPLPRQDKHNIREMIMPAPDTNSAEKEEKETPRPVRAPATVPCQSCGEMNAAGGRHCASCGQPLYRKCLNCGAHIDAVSDECPSCGADMEEAKRAFRESVRENLSRFDILENGASMWLEASNISLEDGETLLIVFPRGNFVTPGPSVVRVDPAGSSRKDSCGVVLTDRRLIIVTEKERMESPLDAIETCMVSDTGKFMGPRHMLILSFDGAVYRLLLPYGSQKAKTVLDLISSYVQAEMAG